MSPAPLQILAYRAIPNKQLLNDNVTANIEFINKQRKLAALPIIRKFIRKCSNNNKCKFCKTYTNNQELCGTVFCINAENYELILE